MSPDHARRILPLADEAFAAVAHSLPEPSPGWSQLAPENAPSGLRFVYRSRDLGTTGGVSFDERSRRGEPALDAGPASPGDDDPEPLDPVPAVHRQIAVYMTWVTATDLASLERDLEPWREHARQGLPVRVTTNGFDVSGPGFAPGWDAELLLARRFRVLVTLSYSEDPAPLTDFLGSWDLRATEAALARATESPPIAGGAP